MSERSSRLRQRLVELSQKHQQNLEKFLSEKGPLIRGSFGTRERVCGKPGCRCSRGELHESKYLTATEEGKVRQAHVPASEESMVAEGVARYRRFRQLRTRLAGLGAEELKLIERLGESLLEPYPPAKPFPPAKRRGRRKKRRAPSS
jgi:hypothetical protein